MQQRTLSITYEIDIAGERGMREMWQIEAETDWEGGSPEAPEILFPQDIKGWFLNVSSAELMTLREAKGMLVFVNTRRYKFVALEHDGVFILRRDW